MPKLQTPVAEFTTVKAIKDEIRKEWRSAEMDVKKVGQFDQNKRTSRILDLIERLRDLVGPEEFERQFRKDPEVWGPLLREFDTATPPQFNDRGGIIPTEGEGNSLYRVVDEQGNVERGIDGRQKSGLLGSTLTPLDYDSTKQRLKFEDIDPLASDIFQRTPMIPESQSLNPDVQRSQYEDELRRMAKDGRTRGFVTQGDNAGLPQLSRNYPFRQATPAEMAQGRSMLDALDQRRLESTNPLHGMPDIGNAYPGGFLSESAVLGPNGPQSDVDNFYNDRMRKGGPVVEGLAGPPTQAASMGPQDEYIPEGDPRFDKAMDDLDKLPKKDAKKLKRRIVKGAGLTSGLAFMIGSMIASAGEKSDSETMQAVAEQINEGMDWYDEKVIQRGYEAMGTSREGLLGEDAGFMKSMLGDTAAEAYGLLANVTD